MRRLCPPGRVFRWTLLIAGLAALGGCGSKISEANYFRVQYGMSEDAVEDLLGPAHEESVGPDHASPAATAPASSRPASTRPAVRKTKAWRRGEITIRLLFEDGVVIARSAEGIAAEPPATQPLSGGIPAEKTGTPASMPARI